MNSNERAPRFLIDADPETIATLSTDDLIALSREELLSRDQALIALRALRKRADAFSAAIYKLQESVAHPSNVRVIAAPQPRVRLLKASSVGVERARKASKTVSASARAVSGDSRKKSSMISNR